MMGSIKTALGISLCLPTLPSAERVSKCPRITAKLCFALATNPGVQRGEAPLRFFSSPRLGARGLARGIDAEGLCTGFPLSRE